MAIIGGIITIILVAWFWWGKAWDEWRDYPKKHYKDNKYRGYDW